MLCPDALCFEERQRGNPPLPEAIAPPGSDAAAAVAFDDGKPAGAQFEQWAFLQVFRTFPPSTSEHKLPARSALSL